ncbi:RES domain-containing protein [Rhizobium sp.]|uniref:RES family NAD+ phosphorylase n=1 Tax=Rhizobium sp. TaxID=391 RepID=UPI0028978A1B
MKVQGVCYRAHDPRWATSPVSGDGAAIRGARFNPKGVPALYLSTSIEGAITEASQGFGHKIHPLTICSYEVDCEDIADLTTEDMRRQLKISFETMSSAWASALSEGRRPSSWVIYDTLSQSHSGILVPSFAHRASPSIRNLVLWKWATELPHKVEVIDPTGRLPRNQRSWEN